MLALPVVLLLSAAAFAAPVQEFDNEAQATHEIAPKLVPAPSKSNFDARSSYFMNPSVDQYSTFTKPVVRNQYEQKPFDYQQQDHVQAHSVQQQAAEVTTPFARIVMQDMEVNPDGSFYNAWNSDNGISVQEQGVSKHVGKVDVAVSQGEISYVDNEGHQYHLKYVADENGFRVEGDHLPTPPPLPIGIARGLQYIAEHPFVDTTTVDSENYYPTEAAPVVIDN